MKSKKQIIKEQLEIGGPYRSANIPDYLNASILNSAFLNAFEGEVLGKDRSEIFERALAGIEEFKDEPHHAEEREAILKAAQEGREEAMTKLDQEGY